MVLSLYSCDADGDLGVVHLESSRRKHRESIDSYHNSHEIFSIIVGLMQELLVPLVLSARAVDDLSTLGDSVDGMERSSRDHREYRDLSMRAIDSLDAILKSCEGIESIDDIIDGPRRSRQESSNRAAPCTGSAPYRVG